MFDVRFQFNSLYLEDIDEAQKAVYPNKLT